MPRGEVAGHGSGSASAPASVKSADRVMRLLEHLAEAGPRGFAAIARALEIPNSSAHQLLSTLVAGGFVAFDSATRTFRLGPRLWAVAQAYRRPDDLAGVARPLMEDLVDQLGETVQLSILEGRHNVYLAVVDSPHPMRLASAVGRRLPAHATGLGKTLLAGLSDERVTGLLSGVTLEVYTPNTLPDLDAVLAEVARIREQGYGEDAEEFVIGCRCVAMPVRDAAGETVAALSVTVPTPRLNEAFVAEIHTELAQTVRALEQQLG